MSLKLFERKNLKDKIEEKELDKIIDKVTADKVDKAEESKPRVKASKKI